MIYDAPHLRARVDTDLLIRREQLEAAEQVFAAHGWSRHARDGLRARRRAAALREGGARVRRRASRRPLANRQSADLLRCLSFEDLGAGAVPLPALGGAARAPREVDACSSPACTAWPITTTEWICCGSGTSTCWSRVCRRRTRRSSFSIAVRTGMTGVCVRGLDLVSAAFGTPGAGALASRLRAAGDGRPEPASRFLDGVRPITTLQADLARFPGWRIPLRMLGGARAAVAGLHAGAVSPLAARVAVAGVCGPAGSRDAQVVPAIAPARLT